MLVLSPPLGRSGCGIIHAKHQLSVWYIHSLGLVENLLYIYGNTVCSYLAARGGGHSQLTASGDHWGVCCKHRFNYSV